MEGDDNEQQYGGEPVADVQEPEVVDALIDDEQAEDEVRMAFAYVTLTTGLVTVVYPVTMARVLLELGFEPYPLSRGRRWIFAGRDIIFLPNVLTYARYLVRDYGIRALFTGYESAVFANLTSRTAIKYASNYIDDYFPNFGGEPLYIGATEEELTNHESFRRLVRSAMRGTFTNCLGVVVSRPFTVIMVRKIAQLIGQEMKYQHLLQSVMCIGHEEGISGYFKGLVPALLMEAAYVWGVHLVIYAFDRTILYGLRMKYFGDDEPARISSLAARKTAKFLTPYTIRVITHPLSVISTLMATIGSGLVVSLIPYSPPIDHWQDAYNSIGPNGLKRGGSLFFRPLRGEIITGPDNLISDVNNEVMEITFLISCVTFPVVFIVSCSSPMPPTTTFTLAPPEELYDPPSGLKATSHVPDLDTYDKLHEESISLPDKFWERYSSQLHFQKRTDSGLEWNFDRSAGPIQVSYMKGSTTNIAYNCLERNINRGLGDKVAYYWEGNVPGDELTVTYSELLQRVKMFAKVLKRKGIKQGDRVVIYLPMIIDLPVAMLACARIGAVHSVVFAGFSAQALASRIVDSKSKMLITCDAYCRGGRLFYLKPLADEAIKLAAKEGTSVESCLMVDYIGRGQATLPDGCEFEEWRITVHEKDSVLSHELNHVDDSSDESEWFEAEDELFILYTSGSTGVAKGILHTVAGYQTYAYATTQNTFDLQPDDVYFCTADCGWITGHTYIVYGPLLNGVTSVMFEGLPTFPMPDRYWRIIEKYRVTKFYTAPTAIRSLMAYKPEFVTACDLSSLRIIGTVGEPINAAAWRWLYRMIGNKQCAIVDTYWQTETGGHIITSMPSAMPMKPGSAALPCFGIDAVILDADGNEIREPYKEGMMCVRQAWPGMMRTIAGNHTKFENTYFSMNGYYFTGDGAYRDSDGYVFITGRVDDLMNVSGHLLSTAEIESALTTHQDVVEAAVVASPHPIKGTTPYAFVTLKKGVRLNRERIEQMKLKVRGQIGAISVPEFIQEAPSLPKTRSGKITRRILRKIAEGDRNADLGDTSTLADKSVIDQLWVGRRSGCAG